MNNKPFWIKKRHNPQLGTYFVACGRMSLAEARGQEYALYGSNEMLRLDTEAEYLDKLEELRAAGEEVHP